MPDTIKSGATAPEHLTHAELLEALKVCDELDGCRKCPNLIPGTLGELGDVEIGKCRFELHAETLYALGKYSDQAAAAESQEPDDVTAAVCRIVKTVARRMDDIAAEPETARAFLRLRLLEVLGDPDVFDQEAVV